ncbi:PAS domain S-box protein [Dyadobacter sp. CY323]|uniref:PAS domain S-box protein n=1 Tax=Dyadobacter sp. CY323 TaxID=2907302 RepID=UPI001F480224|nr:PAS domain S-box protein [Dyadobacter sp. CY323]MCE6992967.1 PAS domain S-box protein [Dyadobacter sp. CY323]
MINTPELKPDDLPSKKSTAKEYRQLIRSFAQALWETDANGQVLEDSDSWQAYTGQTPGESRGEGWAEAVHPDDRSSALIHWRVAVRTGQNVNTEFRLRCPDRSWCWTNLRANPVRDDDGDIIKWLCVNLDITGQKLAQQGLQQSETQFRLLTTLNSDTVYKMNADWSLMVNLKGFDFLEDTVHSNRSWFEQYIPPGDRAKVKSAIDKARSTKTLFELEHQVYVVDGTVGWAFSRAVPLFDEHGQITEWFGTARDVTKRKYAEQRQAFLLELSDELRALGDPLAIQEAAARLLGQRLGADRVLYSEIAGNGLEYLIARNYVASADTVAVIGNFSTVQFGQWLIDAGKAGHTMVVSNVMEDARLSSSERDAFLGIGVRAFIITPLNKEGKWVAAVKIHQAQPRKWTSLEISLVEEVAEYTWAAVERARAEEALSDSEKRLRLAIDATQLATWEWNLNTDDELWNEQHFRMLGMEVENKAQSSATFLDRVHPDDRAWIVAELSSAIAEQGLYDADFRIVRQNDGAVRWMSGYGRVTEIVDGTPVQMSGVMFDITDRKQAEESLRHSEQRQRAILESARDYAILTLNTDRTVSSWNTGAENMMGYTEAEIIGKSGDIFFVPEDRAKGGPEREVEQALETGRAENERWHLRKDGSRFYGSGVTTALMNEAGDVIGVLKVMRNLTAQKEAEDALRKSQERLQKALRIPTVGVLFFDDAGNFTSANNAFLTIGGYSRAEVESRQLNISEMTLPEWMPRTQQALHELRTIGRSTPFEKQLRRPDGSRWWGLFAGTQLSQTEYVEFVLDITYRKKTEEALLEADRRKDEFLALLAHELRNPMATLSNTLMLLELTGGQQEILPLETALSMMRREMAQLVRLVDDLLDVSRINQGKIVLKLERLDLTRLVEESLQATRPLIDNAQRQLTATLPGEPLYLHGDATRLTQVVRNLLTNATKFSNEDGRIWLDLTREGNEAVLRVRDEGIGIPADQLDRIFGLFAQVDTSRTRSQGGLGLGLTLVREFVKKHGGRVEARSPGPGLGSEFIIHLPLQKTIIK